MKLAVAVDIVQGHADDFPTDVLMLKYAPRSGGYDLHLKSALKKQGDARLAEAKPEVGDYVLVEAPPTFGAKYFLMVGTVSVFDLGYAAIRTLAHDMLASLQDAGLDIKHVTTTLHGVNIRSANDEVEAFRAMLLGFADAFERDNAPPGLEKISIIEREERRVELMREALAKFITHTPSPALDANLRMAADDVEAILTGVESFAEDYQQPVADDATPHIFVAMPFSDEYDDHYYLAIRPAIEQNRVLCIRLDETESTFTGDIVEQIKRRIQSAALVVALLDGQNPNVYLEVGYAWGVGTPALLILHEEEKPPFDVQGARLLYYKRMHKLKEQLTDEIRKLLK
jgi:hypothetical protein